MPVVIFCARIVAVRVRLQVHKVCAIIKTQISSIYQYFFNHQQACVIMEIITFLNQPLCYAILEGAPQLGYGRCLSTENPKFNEDL